MDVLTEALAALELDKARIEAVVSSAASSIEACDVIVSVMGVEEAELYTALASYLGLPFRDSEEGLEPDPSTVGKASMRFCRSFRIIPVRQKKEGGFIAATAAPLEFQAQDDLQALFGEEMELVVVTPSVFEKLVARYYELESDIAGKVIESIRGDTAVGGAQGRQDSRREGENLLDMAAQAPVVQLVNSFIYEAVKARASDIHIEPYEDRIKVRYRIDGVLYDAPAPPKELQSLIISRIKLQARMDISESRLPQDGSMTVSIGSRRLDVRVSTIPTRYGERVVMRLLDKGRSVLRLEELGFESDALERFASIVRRPHGIVLVTGPTGSGKSTTLYSVLTTINSSEKMIITLEDPIENEIRDISQVQVKPEIGLTFARGLRHILRQDPDVIMIGEIRDLETAEIAVQSSLTGHMVFSTLHTNDSAGAVTRLVDMGVEPYLLASSLLAVLAQRLVRVLCGECKVEERLSDEEAERVGLGRGKTVFRAAGCPRCRNTGYEGRIGIFELLILDEEIREAVHASRRTSEIRSMARERGMRTLREDGLLKVARGVTSLKELDRVTQGE